MYFKNNKIVIVFFILLVVCLLVFYYFINPQSNSFLIKCPFKIITGLDCPGCGSQRAAHEILHGNFKTAFFLNPFFILMLPYAFVGILFEYFSLKYKFPKTRKILFGKTAIYILVGLTVLFFILRNL